FKAGKQVTGAFGPPHQTSCDAIHGLERGLHTPGGQGLFGQSSVPSVGGAGGAAAEGLIETVGPAFAVKDKLTAARTGPRQRPCGEDEHQLRPRCRSGLCASSQ
ncbi:hypothetical protein KUCAC02_013515, partial [Chaenocephalus aceratus]